MLHTPGMRRTLDVHIPCTAELDLPCTQPVAGRLVLTSTGNVLVVQGELSISLKSVCPRCLADVFSDAAVPVDEEFAVDDCTITGRADDDSGMADPTVAALWQDRRLLNLTELVRQAIVLELPGEPLCREDCKGLCAQCGANLNDTQCDCRPATGSPFGALAALYKTNAD